MRLPLRALLNHWFHRISCCSCCCCCWRAKKNRNQISRHLASVSGCLVSLEWPFESECQIVRQIYKEQHCWPKYWLGLQLSSAQSTQQMTCNRLGCQLALLAHSTPQFGCSLPRLTNTLKLCVSAPTRTPNQSSIRLFVVWLGLALVRYRWPSRYYNWTSRRARATNSNGQQQTRQLVCVCVLFVCCESESSKWLAH